MLYAGGMKFILLSAVLYAPGTLLYFWGAAEAEQASLHRSGMDHLHRRGRRLHRGHLWARD
jgi:hypothetical protein